MANKRRGRATIRSEVLTLRMTTEEMLRFKVAALSMGRKRSRIVRERVADLISGAPSVAPAVAVEARGTPDPGVTVGDGQ